MKYYVYLHIKETNGEPFYIGKGIGNRVYSKNRSKWWKRTVDKYGYDVIMLEDNLSESKSFEREIYWIDRIGRKDLNKGTLINMTDGGEGISGHKHTDEQRSKISKGRKGQTLSQECKHNLSKLMSGENNPNYGKETSIETRLKISKSNKGLTRSEETKRRMSEAAKKRWNKNKDNKNA